MSDGPRIAVVTFPGTNDDGDAVLALELLGAAPVLLGLARGDDSVPGIGSRKLADGLMEHIHIENNGLFTRFLG